MRTRPTIDIDQEFSKNLDQILQGETAEACNSVSEEYRATLEFAEMLARSKPFPRPAFRDGLKRKVMHRLGLSGEVRSQRSAQLYPRRRVMVMAALLLFCLSGLTLLQARGSLVAAWEGIVNYLEHIGVREVKPERRWELPPSEVPTYATVAEAQRHVDFPIREPAYLPPGFRLEGVQVPDASSVGLGYRRETEDRGIELLYLSQSSLAGKVAEYADYPGEIQEIELQGRRAVWGTDKQMNLLIWEDEDMVFVLHSTLPLTEMQNVAISLFDE